MPVRTPSSSGATADATGLRLTFLAVLILSFFVLLVARLWFLQVMTGDSYVARAEGQALRTIQIDAPRGDILDRDGQPLVDNRYAQVISVRPEEMGDEEEREAIIAELADILGMTPEQVTDRIEHSRESPVASRPIAYDVPADVVFYIHENRATRFPGVYVERVPLREYPHGDLAAHVVGYTGEISQEELDREEFDGYDPGDVIGWSGIERAYEHVLQGDKGAREVQVNARGEVIGDVVEEIPPVSGADVVLTLDLEAQQIAEEALAAGIGVAQQTVSGGDVGGLLQAPAGAAVVLDPDTGAVVAMASYPTFQPSAFVGGVSHDYWNALQDPANHFPLINRAIAGTYPPGSVYKVVSGAAALSYGFLGHDEYLPCPPEFTWNENVYRNWSTRHFGSLNMAEALQHSCDTVFYNLAQQMFYAEQNTPEGSDDDPSTVPFEFMPEMSRAFGLGAVTGIDLPGERAGRVPGREWRAAYWEQAKDQYCYQATTASPGSYARELFTELCNEGFVWRGGDEVNMSIGQGDLQVTPLQIANVYAAIANRGRVMRPHLVHEIHHPDGRVEQTIPEVLLDVDVADEDFEFLERGLLMVTEEGGTAGSVFGQFEYAIAGKTGTAEQKPKQPVAWFAAYNPQPIGGERYVVVVMVEEGGSGSQVAAPIAREIFRGLFEGDIGEVTAGEATD